METMASAEHFMATDVEWDPTGRYVTTAVTSVHQMENGFHVWTFNGGVVQVSWNSNCLMSWRGTPGSSKPDKKE